MDECCDSVDVPLASSLLDARASPGSFIRSSQLAEAETMWKTRVVKHTRVDRHLDGDLCLIFVDLTFMHSRLPDQ